jgi:hypothetical protein
VYLADIFSCADGANTAGTRSRRVSIDREVLNAFPCVAVEKPERVFMMDSFKMYLGGIARIRESTSRAAVN